MDKKRLSLLVLGLVLFLLVESVEALSFKEGYTTGDDTSAWIYGVVWNAQTFTTNSSYYIRQVELKLYRIGSPGTVTASIRATSGGSPTGTDWVSGTINGNTLTTSMSGAWYNITFSSSTLLQNNTQYAIVVRAPSGTYPSNMLCWEFDGTSATYMGGQYAYSTDSGATWIIAPYSSYDLMFRTFGDNYTFTFKGLFNEDSGELYPVGYREVGVNVFFEGAVYDYFLFNESYVYSTSNIPIRFEIANISRQFYVAPDETFNQTIYVFNSLAGFTLYTISFLDLGGILRSNPYIVAEHDINGTMFVVEKRKVDAENKVQMRLRSDHKYTLVIEGLDFSYTFGELLTTATTSITLTLHGVDFPKETLLRYKYVRIYGERVFDTPNGTITITYQDLLNLTVSVIIYFKYKNGTLITSTTQTSDTFSYVWTQAMNNTDYRVEATISHERYGVYTWKQFFYRKYTTNPFSFKWLGASLDFDVNFLLGIFIVVCVGAGFSMINPEIGALLATLVAAGLTVMGWLPLAPGTLISAFCLSIMFGIVVARRRVQTY